MSCGRLVTVIIKAVGRADRLLHRKLDAELQVSRPTLYELMEKLSIRKEDKSSRT